MHDVKDKVFLITGGAAGIGAGVVKAFLNEGAKHIAILDVDVKSGAALEAELAQVHGQEKVKFYNCDITTDDLISTYDNVVKKLGYIDVVVNCAGIMNDSAKVYTKAIAVNVTALITSSLKAYELMRKDKDGRGGTIVNIASIVALTKGPLLPIYHATKSAVLQFSQCLGDKQTYNRTGVRVVTLCFGCTDTSLLAPGKANVFDSELLKQFFVALGRCPLQSSESAVSGLVEAYKKGDSASTWLVTSDRPAEDITPNINKAYTIMSEGIFE